MYFKLGLRIADQVGNKISPMQYSRINFKRMPPTFGGGRIDTILVHTRRITDLVSKLFNEALNSLYNVHYQVTAY